MPRHTCCLEMSRVGGASRSGGQMETGGVCRIDKRQSSPSSQGREFLLCLTGPGPAQGLPARSILWDAREEGESRVSSTLGSRRALPCSTSCQQRSSPADSTQVLPFPADGPRLRPSRAQSSPLQAQSSGSLGSGHFISYVSSLGCLLAPVCCWSFSGSPPPPHLGAPPPPPSSLLWVLWFPWPGASPSLHLPSPDSGTHCVPASVLMLRVYLQHPRR